MKGKRRHYHELSTVSYPVALTLRTRRGIVPGAVFAH